MPEVNSNYFIPAGINGNQPQSQYEPYGYTISPELSLKDEFLKEHKKNGLFERLYNGIKNLTGLGIGSKKTQAVVNKAENGEITEEQAREAIDKYRTSQANSEQAFGDLMSVGASGLSFWWLNKGLRSAKATADVNNPIVRIIRWSMKFLPKSAQSEIEFLEKELEKETSLHRKNYLNEDLAHLRKEQKAINFISKSVNKFLDTIKSKKRLTAIAAVLSILAGGIAKKWTLKFNRVGSDEFKVRKEDFNGAKTAEDKAEYKLAKKQIKKERRSVNRRNRRSGWINGAMAPLMLLGGWVAAPIMLVGNSLNRYFIGNHQKKDKSFKGYTESLKEDVVLNTAIAAGMAVPMIKKGNWTKIFNRNIEKAASLLKDAKLKNPEFEKITAYDRLESILLGSPEIEKIINDESITMNEKITKLTDKNIFAVKFCQIHENGDPLSDALKKNCPPTRCTFKDGVYDFTKIQEYVDKVFKGEYKVDKLYGVGTVAETYRVIGKDGKAKCIKVLKEGINAEKIKRDGDEFIDMIEKSDIAREQKDYLIANIKNLKEGILKEVDFNNEKLAAEKLAQHTKRAAVVKGLEVRDGIYVMEEAKGVSLRDFLEINRLYIEREVALQHGLGTKGIDESIEAMKLRMPDVENLKFNKADSDYLLQKYRELYIEQFHKIEAGGKSIHADIHTGNIMIDPEALRRRHGNLFTLIDTGNVVDMGVEQSMRALNLAKFVEQGSVRDIAEYVLNDVTAEGLKASGLTKEQAIDEVEKQLKVYFFDNQTKLTGTINEGNILSWTDSILQNLRIVPGTSQFNLSKGKKSARDCLDGLMSSIEEFQYLKLGKKKSKAGKAGTLVTNIGENQAKDKMYQMAIKIQEQENMKQLSKSLQRKYKHNPNKPADNSVEYQIYKLKQRMVGFDDLGLPEEVFNKLEKLESVEEIEQMMGEIF